MENLISVVMPVYNKAPHIDRSIRSILQQTFQEFELIIVDDGSTDGSLEIVQAFNDNRIRIFQRDTPGPGGYKARNLGIKESLGSWIAFLDADDEWRPNYLEEVSAAITQEKNVDVITSRWIWVDENKTVEKRVEHLMKYNRYIPFGLQDFLQNQDIMWTGAVVIEKDLILRSGGFPTCPKCKKGGDMDTWIRVLKESRCAIMINEPLALYYRDTVNRVTSSKNNPTSYLCSYDGLIKIYSDTENRDLQKAIRFFVNKNVYNILANHLNATEFIDVQLWKKMFPNIEAIKYSLKLIIRFLLIKLRLL